MTALSIPWREALLKATPKLSPLVDALEAWGKKTEVYNPDRIKLAEGFDEAHLGFNEREALRELCKAKLGGEDSNRLLCGLDYLTDHHTKAAPLLRRLEEAEKAYYGFCAEWNSRWKMIADNETRDLLSKLKSLGEKLIKA